MSLGPVQPAAQCSLQQSMSLGPLHLREHCSAQFNRVTDSETQKRITNTGSSLTKSHRWTQNTILNLQVWQFSGPGAQHDPLEHPGWQRLPETQEENIHLQKVVLVKTFTKVWLTMRVRPPSEININVSLYDVQPLYSFRIAEQIIIGNLNSPFENFCHTRREKWTFDVSL